MDILTDEEQTRAFKDIPFADLRGKEARDTLCKTQALKTKAWIKGELEKLPHTERTLRGRPVLSFFKDQWDNFWKED